MEFRIFTIEKKGVFRPRYLIKEGDKLRYVGQISGFLNRSQLYDTYGNLVMQAHKDWKKFKKIYDLSKGGLPIGQIHLKMGFSKNEIIIQSSLGDFEITGSWKSKDFLIKQGDIEIAQVSRKSVWSYEFGIAFRTEEDAEMMSKMLLSIVLLLNLKAAAGAG